MSTKPDPRVRVQRPDTSATETTEATDDSVSSSMGGVSTLDVTPDVALATETVDTPDDTAIGVTTHFQSPFSATGSVVEDSQGRAVAIVGGAHMTPDSRNNAAIWLANKLNG